MKKKIIARILALHRLYHTGQIKTLAQHEVNPGLEKSSRENYLYFTLPPCLNFQRSSPAMWQAALATWNDRETNYLFFPEAVIKRPVKVIQRDLLKHKLGLQKNKHTDIWIRISSTLAKNYQNDPRAVLAARNFDAEKILTLLRVEQKHLFPYLSGPKMANYWLYILSQYTDVAFTNMQAISIIPDTHVLQCSIQLGIANYDDSPEIVAQTWRELLANTRLTPVEMHPVLWNWSRNNFIPAV